MRGQNLVEFAVIIAVVGIVSIAALVLLGNNTNETYNKSSNKYGEFKPFEFKNDGNNEIEVVPGSLGGSVNKPISQCSGNSCDIDFGGLVLKNVPLNFSEYVKLNGTGGGSDKIAALLEQIAESLKAKGDDTGYEQYKKLANIGHLMAALDGKVEDLTRSCIGYNSSGPLVQSPELQRNCVMNQINKQYDIGLNQEVADSIPGFDSNFSIAQLVAFTRIDKIRGIKEGYGSVDPSYDMIDLATNNKISMLEKSPGLNFIETFDSIMSNPNYTDNLKGITKELYLSMNDLTVNMGSKVTYLSNLNSSPTLGYTIHDPITGKALDEHLTFNEEDDIVKNPIDAVLKPQISTGTNFTSALICAAGSNKDTGTVCHK